MMTSCGSKSRAMAIIDRWRMPPRELVRIASQMDRVDPNHAQDLGRPLADFLGRYPAVLLTGIAHLRGQRLDRVEGVHGALHDDGELSPAQVP